MSSYKIMPSRRPPTTSSPPWTFPFVLGALLALSLALFGVLLYASVHVVVVSDVRPRRPRPHDYRPHQGNGGTTTKEDVIDVDLDAYHTYSFLLRRTPSGATRAQHDDEEEGRRYGADGHDDGKEDKGGDGVGYGSGSSRRGAGAGSGSGATTKGGKRSTTTARLNGNDGGDTDPRKEATTKEDGAGARMTGAGGRVENSPSDAAAASAPAETDVRTPSSFSSPYAYAFLLVGCDPANPRGYRPLLASVYVALHLLRTYGSVQDAIVYVMMAPTTTTSSTLFLPEDELRALRELNATVRQIPTVSKPTFHRIMLQKFRVLGLTQYRRILFLDCDVMPLRNLDELFTLSDPQVTNPPVLQENLIFLDYVSPANGGTFMLAPHPGDLRQVNDLLREAQLVRNRGVEGMEPWRQFEPDAWEGFEKGGREYDFHAVSGDQGLLWSWVRHYQRRFSYVVKDGSVRNYVPDDDKDNGGGDKVNNNNRTKTNRVRLESVIARPFVPHLAEEVWPIEVSVWGTKHDAERRRKAHPLKPGTKIMPHQEHLGVFGYLFHFLLATGGKPWYGVGCSQRWDATGMPARQPGIEHAERARRFWCQTYHEVAIRHNLSTQASDVHGVDQFSATSHHTIGSEMWATPGPVTNLLEPDVDPWSHYAATSSSSASSR